MLILANNQLLQRTPHKHDYQHKTMTAITTTVRKVRPPSQSLVNRDSLCLFRVGLLLLVPPTCLI